MNFVNLILIVCLIVVFVEVNGTNNDDLYDKSLTAGKESSDRDLVKRFINGHKQPTFGHIISRIPTTPPFNPNARVIKWNNSRDPRSLKLPTDTHRQGPGGIRDPTQGQIYPNNRPVLPSVVPQHT